MQVRVIGDCMKELIQRLSMVPDAYDDFIMGVINYAEKDTSHVEVLNNYMSGNADLTSSDIVRFIMEQPDFHDFSAVK